MKTFAFLAVIMALIFSGCLTTDNASAPPSEPEPVEPAPSPQETTDTSSDDELRQQAREALRNAQESIQKVEKIEEEYLEESGAREQEVSARTQ